jgi:putative transcriptional regulator
MARTTGSESLFERLQSSLQQGIRHAKGETNLRTVSLPDPPPKLDAKQVLKLRRKLRMSQTVFACVLNVSYKTVQSWEQGTRSPSHAALRLLQLLSEAPDTVVKTVSG